MHAFQSSSEGVKREQQKGVFIVKFGSNILICNGRKHIFKNNNAYAGITRFHNLKNVELHFNNIFK